MKMMAVAATEQSADHGRELSARHTAIIVGTKAVMF
jgi:hypothetical protein